MERYALNLAENGRVLSATYPQYAPANAVVADSLPEGDITDYIYAAGRYVYDPLPRSVVSDEATEADYIESPESLGVQFDE